MLMSAKQLAAELGFTVSQIQKLARRGEIPCMRFASEYRFDLDEVKQARRYQRPDRVEIRTDAARSAVHAFWRARRNA